MHTLLLRRLIALGAIVVLCALVARPAVADEEARAFYESALGYFHRGELEEALIESRNALQRDEQLLPAHLLLARIYLDMGVPGVAETTLERATALGADEALIWPLRAEAMLKLRKFQDAVRTIPTKGFEPAVQADLLVSRGHALLELQRIGEAREEYAQAAEADPGAWAPIAALANLALRTGDLTAALEKATMATEVAPAVASAWNIRGDVLRVMGDVDGALASFAAALERDPELAEARLSRAELLVGLGRFDEARADIERLEEPMGFDPRFSYVKAMLFSRTGAPEAARDMLAKARSQLDELGDVLVRSSAQLLMLAGIANFEAGNIGRAREYLDALLEQHPQRRAPRMLLARILLVQGNAGQAIQLLEQVEDRAGRDAAYLALLGDAHGADGQHAEARALLARAAALTPEDRSIQIRLAFAQLNAGEATEGLTTLTAKFREDPASQHELGLRLAQVRLQRAEHAAARDVTRHLIAAAPSNPEFLNLHATALAGLGDFGHAREYFEQALEADPEFIPAALNLARLLLDVGVPTEAHTVLERLLKAHPANAEAMILLSRAAGRTGNPEQALRWLELAHATAPRANDATLELVRLHLQAGRAEAALPIAEEALSVAPEDFDLLAATAFVYLALDRKATALELFKRMSQAAGTDAGRRHRTARLQARAGAYRDALSSLEHALRANPDHLPARVLRIRVLALTGEIERALQETQALRSEHPENTQPRSLEGRLLARLGRHDEAQAVLEALHRESPSTASVLDLARLHGSGGHGQAARGVLEDWLSAHPDDGAVEVALADRLLAAGEYATARRHLEHLLQVHGESPTVLNNLANALHRLGDPGALEMARRAHARAPNSAAIADTLGWILVRRGQPEQGLRHLRDAAVRNASSAEIRYHLAEALASLGRHSEALAELKAALGTDEAFTGAEAARDLKRRLEQ